MLEDKIKALLERVLAEHPKFGSIHIILIFHDGQFVSSEFINAEKELISKEI